VDSRARTRPEEARRGETRFGRAIASPLGVRLLLPLLVLTVGVTTTLLGLRALRGGTLSMAREQLGAQASGMSQDFEFALAQSGPILGRLRRVALADGPSLPFGGSAAALHDIVLAHAGITYVSVSFPDGTFRGAYVENGAVALQESHAGGTRTIYTLRSGALERVREEPSTYDPRKRAFWALAVRRGGRTWTPPYTFFKTHYTGISCAEPVYDASGALHAVITVDYDINGLSSFIATASYRGSRTVIYDADGTVLAYAAPHHAPPTPSADRPLRAEDLQDPAVAALVRRTPTEPRFYDDGDELAAVTPISSDKALRWYVGVLAPRRVVLGPVHALAVRALWANVAAVVASALLSVLLARRIVRMRRDVAEAKVSLVSAETRARELGSYRLVERLASGGQGEIWRGAHRLLAREAAIKLIGGGGGTVDPSVLERFRREAQTLASMRSRHTIELFDFGVTEDGVFYYVMELLDGVDLEGLVRHHGPQPAARVVRLLVQACSSLAEAHEAGLLHRDVKPANVFVCRAADELDVVKLLDFGLVNTAGSHPDEANKILGTPGYMAPEQILGGDLDARADLYALGCVAWWLLTGRDVFEGEPTDAMVAHATKPLPALRPLVGGWLPAALERIVVQCLAKEPAARPASARELADALRAVAVPPEHAWTDASARAWWSGRTHEAAATPEQTARTIVVR
jgi:plasmid stabilization system protein ParE